MRQFLSANLLAAALLFSINLIAADVPENAKTQALGPLAGRLDYRLIPAVKALQDGSATSEQLTAGLGNVFTPANPPMPAGLLFLDLDVPSVTPQILQAIAATGVTIDYSSPRWNSVSVTGTLAQSNMLAQINGVRRVKIAGSGANHAGEGIAYNQVDATIHADMARSVNGLSGAGQKVGVISDSYNDNPGVGAGKVTGPAGNFTITGTTPQNTGDVPAQLQVIDFGPGGSTDEGEAMIELIHDIAPKAAIAFASGIVSQASFADNLQKLREAGCTVTCDDLFHFDEPCFQDGPIAQIISANYDAGVAHFASAGNIAGNGITATYTPVNAASTVDNSLATPNGDDFHNWGLGGPTPGFLPIDVPNGQNVLAILQWNQPFQSYALGPGPSSDMDLLLYDAASAGGTVLASGGEAQFVNSLPFGDSYEIVDYTNNTGATKTVYLAVNHYSGTRSNCVFRVIFLNRWNGLTFPSGGVNGATIYGHAASAKSIAVSAIFYADIETNGGFGPDLAVNAERYTSHGGIGANGIQFFFDGSGKPLASPVKVDKPDITAPDGGNTTLFGNDIAINIGGTIFDTDTMPNFFGTSASTPNAAAVAALMLERASKTTPLQLKNALQMTAHDIVSTLPAAGPGFDDVTGAGWIDANAAVNLLPGIVVQPVNANVDADTNATFSVTATGSPTLSYQWMKNGAPISGATSSSLTLLITSTDEGAKIQCIVSNSFGTAISVPAVVRINAAPLQITSAFTATPSIAAPAQTVTFSFGVVAAPNPAVTYEFNFGDGTTQPASASGSATHSYAAPGLYTAMVTAADTFSQSLTATVNVFVFPAAENGEPALNPKGDNTVFPNLIVSLKNITPVALTAKLAIQLKFNHDFSDSLTLSGNLSNTPITSSQKISVVIGGLGRTFTLDATTKSVKLPDNLGTLTYQKPGKKTPARFKLALKKTALGAFFADEGLTNKTAKNEPHPVRVSVYFNGVLFDAIVPQSYTATQGKSGKTK